MSLPIESLNLEIFTFKVESSEWIRILKADIGAGYQKALLQIKQLINETCTYATITTNLWIARNNQGYIGITGHWLIPNMKLYDIFICIDLIKYPHTVENIHSALVKKIQELYLNNKVKHAVTDNRANVVKVMMMKVFNYDDDELEDDDDEKSDDEDEGEIQKEIYGALFDYWNDHPMAMLLAIILDSQCKRTHGWPNDCKKE
ncbi:hypothetical protein C1646_763632 [Rhizophagus diaphanus]|nr:hypothetical protein C1646_763632 [Rhizophagus diaphanus] [Rhizophagus sp. MUCL 43196]